MVLHKNFLAAGVGALAIALFTLIIIRAIPHIVPFDGAHDLWVSSGGVVTTKDGKLVATPGRAGIRLPLLSSEVTELGPIETTIHFIGNAQASLGFALTTLDGEAFLRANWVASDTLRITSGGRPLFAEGHPVLILTEQADFFTPSVLGRVRHVLEALSWVWVSVGLMTLCGLSYLVVRRLGAAKIRTVSATRTEPPRELSVMQMAILHHGEIRSIDFVALLIDLARRGFFEVIDEGQDAMFIPKGDWQSRTLESYERGLLAVLFPNRERSQLGEIMRRLDAELFSSMVSQMYVATYQSFEHRLYFKENPRRTHLRIKTIGIALQGIGLLILAGAGLVETPYPIYFGVGIFSSLLGIQVYQVGRAYVRFTPAGLRALQDVSEFMSYLRGGAPLTGEGDLYFKYLPHAFVTDSQDAWLHRFLSVPLYLPDWLSSVEQTMVSPEQYTHLFQSISTHIATYLQRVKDPNAD